jgi:hypothetical protein
MAKTGYTFRSKFVHGNWRHNPEGVHRVFEAEQLVRRSLVRVLQDARLTETFSTASRERYLDDSVFGR